MRVVCFDQYSLIKFHILECLIATVWWKPGDGLHIALWVLVEEMQDIRKYGNQNPCDFLAFVADKLCLWAACM